MAARRASIFATQGAGALPSAWALGLPKRGLWTSKRKGHHLERDSRRPPEPLRALPPRWPPPLDFFDRLAPKANEVSNLVLALPFAIATLLTRPARSSPKRTLPPVRGGEQTA